MKTKKFLSSFIFIIMLFASSCSLAFANNKIELKGNIPYSYRVRDIYGNLTIVNYGKYIYADNEIAFCVQPGVLVNENATYEVNLFTHAQKNEMERIAYAGWHASSQTVEDYLATQFYIWEILGAVIEETSLPDYPARRQTIKDRMNKLFYDYPSFANESYDISATKSITLNDTNNIFNYFSLDTKSEGISIERKNNKIVISASNTASKSSTISFKLVEDKYEGTSMIYQSAISQSVVPFKVEINRKFNIKLNVKHASLKIRKYDSSNKSISKVSFKIARDENFNDLLGTYTTNANGIIEIKQILPDIYYIQEVSTPNNFLLNNTVKKVNVEAGKEIVYDVVNDYRKIILEKQDEKGNLVPNVTFEIGSSSNMEEILGTYKTGSNGRVEIDDIWNLSTIYVREKAVPDYLQLNTVVKKLSLNPNENTVFVAVNEYALMPLTIKKSDPKKKPLEDVIFKISRKSDMSEFVYFNAEMRERTDGKGVSALATNEKGIIKVYLKPGTYYVQEYSAPNNLVVNAKINKVVVPVGESVTYELENDYRKIILEKHDTKGNLVPNTTFEIAATYSMEEILGTYKTGSNGRIEIDDVWNLNYIYIREIDVPDYLQLNSSIKRVKLNPNENTTFVVKNDYRKIVLEKQDEKGNLVPNVTFEIATSFSMDEILGTYKTGSNGRVEIDDVWNLRYIYIREIDAPDHLQLNTSIKRVKLTPNETTKYIAVNEFKEEPVYIKKTDELGNVLSGVTFKFSRKSDMSEYIFFNAEMHERNDGKGVSNVTSGDNGYCKVYLKPGIYYVQEFLAPEGYQLDKKIHQIEVEHGKEIILRIKNKFTQLKIVKKNTNGETLGNVGFEISKDKTFKTLLTFNENGILDSQGSSKFYTDEQGKIVLKKLNSGTYYVREISAPNNICFDETAIYQVQLKKNDTNQITIQNRDRHVRIIKKNQNETKLAGAVFKISKNEDMSQPLTFSDNYLSNQGDIRLVTNSDGEIVLYGLEDGVYFIQEIEAPLNYTLDLTIHRIKVEANKDVEITLYNKGLFIEIYKMNTEKEGIEGVHFQLFDDSSLTNPIAEGETNKDGILYFDHLSAGTYYVKETTTKACYVITEKFYKVELTNQHEHIDVVNDYRKGHLYKYDDKRNPLAGVTFGIYLDEECSQLVEKVVTNEDGMASFDALKDIYYIKELDAPAYCVLDQKVHMMNFKANQDFSLVLTNQIRTLTIAKKDDTGLLREGVVFGIYKDEECTELIYKGVTNNKGEITVPIIEDVVYIKELETSKGLILDERVEKVQMDKHQNVVIERVNECFKFQILKLDEEGKALSGAEFIILDEKGNEVIRFTSSDKPFDASMLEPNQTYILRELKAPAGYQKMEDQTFIAQHKQIFEIKNKPISYRLTIQKVDGKNGSFIKVLCIFGLYRDAACTDLVIELESENGTFNFENLKAGTYYVKEIKAPSGYSLLTKAQKVELLDEEEVTIQVENFKVIPETGVSRDTNLQFQLMKWFAYTLLSTSMFLLVMRRLNRSVKKV